MPDDPQTRTAYALSIEQEVTERDFLRRRVTLEVVTPAAFAVVHTA
jgi:hypothetical protein